MLSNSKLNVRVLPDYQEPIIKMTATENHDAELQNLHNALAEGWQIMETAYLLASGCNAEGKGYMLTLYHPKQSIIKQWDFVDGNAVKNLLELQTVPGYIH